MARRTISVSCLRLMAFSIAVSISALAVAQEISPVAFDASADERDTRGFISITTIRPLDGSIANWMFDPPVSTPISRITRIAASRIR